MQTEKQYKKNKLKAIKKKNEIKITIMGYKGYVCMDLI